MDRLYGYAVVSPKNNWDGGNITPLFYGVENQPAIDQMILSINQRRSECTESISFPSVSLFIVYVLIFSYLQLTILVNFYFFS